MPAHSYWGIRVLEINTVSSGWSTYIQELLMATSAGGATVCNGGIAGATSFQPARPPANAFDNGYYGSSGWIPGGSTFASPQILWYQFTNPVDIVEYTIFTSNYVEERPKTWEFVYSDDGINWTVADSRSNYSFPQSAGNYGSALFSVAIQPVVSITGLNAVKNEGNAGTTDFTFTVSRDLSVGEISVDYAISGDVNAADFSGSALPVGLINFADGVASQTLTISVQGDVNYEQTESFIVTLSNPIGCIIGVATATGFIQNDDTGIAGVYIGGANWAGQLGLGDKNDRHQPTLLLSDNPSFKSAGLGEQHTAIIKNDGTLWICGSGLATGNALDVLTLTQVGIDSDWKIVVSGYGGFSALKTNGELWSVGINYAGQTGIDNGDVDLTVLTLVPVAKDIKFMSANGCDQLYVIKFDGTLWDCGWNGGGELGLSDGAAHNFLTKVGAKNNWASIFASFTPVAIDSHHVAWGCGKAFRVFTTPAFNRLGLGQEALDEQGSVIPHLEFIPIATNVKKAAAGDNFTVLLKQDGTLWAAGYGVDGSLGQGNFDNTDVFVQMGTDNDWIDIGGGDNHTMAIKRDGTLWACGNNSWNYSLGIPDGINRNILTLVDTFGLKVNQLEVGGYHYLLSLGKALQNQIWMNNVNSQLNSPLSSSDYSLSILIADVQKFGVLQFGQYFDLTITEGEVIEIVRIVEMIGNVFTIYSRGLENTTISNFTGAAKVYVSITAGAMNDLLAK